MKACPFCGSLNKLVCDTSRSPNDGDKIVWVSTVVCRNCNAVGPIWRTDHPATAGEGAIERWNRRGA